MEHISKTVFPTQTLSLGEWLTEVKAGINAPKQNSRATEMMKMWEKSRPQNSGSIFKDIINRLKI